MKREPLKTLTWGRRNEESLQELKKIVGSLKNPKILIIGPGAMSSVIAKVYPDMPKSKMDLKHKISRFFLKMFDGFIRKRFSNSQLVVFEVRDVLNIFSNLKPTVTCIDKYDRVLDAIDYPVEKLKLNIFEDKIPFKVDIVICFNVLFGKENASEGLSNIINCVEKNGYLCFDENVIVPNLERLKKGIYRKN